MATVGMLNSVVTRVFNLVCWPFQGVAPIWPLVAISLVTGVVMVWVFGRVSDQAAIREIRNRIRGNLIGVRVFRHDVAVVMALQGRIFQDTGKYLKKSAVPTAVLLVPVVLVMSQLNLRFAVRPLAVGETTVVKAYVRDAALLDQPLRIEAPTALRIETPGVRIAAEREIAWRLRAVEPGRHTIVIRVGDDRVETAIVVGSGWQAIPQRATSAVQALLYPGGTIIPSGSPLAAVLATYPPLDVSALGISLNWLLWFFGLSMIFGFLFKGALGVDL